MKAIYKSAVLAAMSGGLYCNFALAATNIGSYDASLTTAPNAQGWANSYTNQGGGSLISDLGSDAWNVDGINGRAEWQITPTSATNSDASTNGWRMSWTSRIVSGTYNTNYYGNGSKRFLPIIKLNTGNDLIVDLEGNGTYTLVTGAGDSAYHSYEVVYNPATGTASFLFDGTTITSNWAGSNSTHNVISWGDGSTGTDTEINYQSFSFDIEDPQPVTSANEVVSYDTSSLSFDGSSQYQDISSDLASLTGLTQGTIFASFKATGSTATLLSLSNAQEGSSEYAILIGSGPLQIHARENGSFVNSTSTTEALNDSRLHNAAIVVSAAGTKIFVDGKLAGTSSASAFFSSIGGINSGNIGRNEDNGGGQWYYNGEIHTLTVYDGPMSDSEAMTLTTLTQDVATYDASAGESPVQQGWTDDTSGSASGSLIQDSGDYAWQANGTAGRAQWKYIPSSNENAAASQAGWSMTTVLRVLSGNYITNYYANGSKRFMPILSINAQGDLIATLEGGGTHTLVSGTGSSDYHTYSVVFDPSVSQATFSFDGTVVETWSGSSSSQNMVVWGNGSSGTAGMANYRSAEFKTFVTYESPFYTNDVFTGGAEGTNGTSNYRIPSMTQAPDGTLLAFIEGRPSGADPGQAGEINISLKRSTDNGRSWQPVQIIHQDSSYDYSDPRPLVDNTTGDVFIFYVQWPTLCAQNGDCVGPNDPNHIFYRKSSDNGLTWSTPVNVSSQVKDPTWRSYNPGPGQGIQLARQTQAQGANNNRLLFPMIIRAGDSKFYVASGYSDDNGATWAAGNLTPTDGPTEADIVELNNGQILLSARNDSGKAGTRYHFLSDDGGITWTQTTHDLAISKVDIGMTRYSSTADGDAQNRILLSGPIGNPVGSNRNDLGVWISTDEGQTFGTPHQLIYGFSAYSDILKMQDGTIGIVYEATGNTSIKFINVDLATLEGL